MKLLRFAFIFFAALPFLMSCKSSSKSDNYGPESSYEDFQNKQELLLSQVNPLLIENGEFAYYLKTQQVFSTQQPSELLMEEEAISVIDREDHPDHFIITAVREVIDYLQADKPHFKYKEVFKVYRDDFEEPTARFKTLKLLANASDSEQVGETKISFHNVKISDIKVERPKKVQDREPCPEGQSCLLNAKELSYDVIITEEGQPPHKTQFDVIVSGDVPYFASILKNCLSTVVTIEDSRPIVRQCKTLYDYQYKTPVN